MSREFFVVIERDEDGCVNAVATFDCAIRTVG